MEERLKQQERYLFSSNEKSFGESTQLISQIISSNVHSVKTMTTEIRDTQKLISNEQCELRKKIDDFITYSTEICSEISLLEKEATSLSSIEMWIVNISNEMKSLKSQSLYLHEIIKEEFKQMNKSPNDSPTSPRIPPSTTIVDGVIIHTSKA